MFVSLSWHVKIAGLLPCFHFVATCLRKINSLADLPKGLHSPKRCGFVVNGTCLATNAEKLQYGFLIPMAHWIDLIVSYLVYGRLLVPRYNRHQGITDDCYGELGHWRTW